MTDRNPACMHGQTGYCSECAARNITAYRKALDEIESWKSRAEAAIKRIDTLEYLLWEAARTLDNSDLISRIDAVLLHPEIPRKEE